MTEAHRIIEIKRTRKSSPGHAGSWVARCSCQERFVLAGQGRVAAAIARHIAAQQSKAALAEAPKARDLEGRFTA